jgi:hypothetical protein
MNASKNIYWRDVQKQIKIAGSFKVLDHGASWSFGGACVFWHGQEARQAQQFLKEKAIKVINTKK